MKTRNKIGFDYEKKPEETITEEVKKDFKEALMLSPAHANLKDRIAAIQEYMLTEDFAKAEKGSKQYQIESLMMFVSLDAELEIKSGIGVTLETSVQDLTNGTKEEGE